MQTQQKLIEVTVNGHQLKVHDQLTILQALLQEEIHVPHLCYDLRLKRASGSCGLCVVEVGEGKDKRDVKACQTPIRAGMVITTDSPRLEDYRKMRLEQLLADHNADCVAPCVSTCPANVDIQLYLRHVADGNLAEAIKVIKESNPFPMVCGRVCPHPCEAACRRNLVDEPVGINNVKRFLADWDLARDEPWSPAHKPTTGKQIAVVGAGPSGLAAAYYAALLGHEVTVFESRQQAGGMMRYGIPEYRLPKTTLDQEIRFIENLGVKIIYGKTLGKDISLKELQRDFDAVYVAIGAWRASPLGISGESQAAVWQGIRYLEQVASGADLNPGEIVAVIGGGNTAIDCARTALRQGAKAVKLIYRRTQAEMPAEPHEIAAALEEGIEMLFLMAPTQFETVAGGKNLLTCTRMELGEPDYSGRRRPVPIAGSETVLAVDTVIGAVGQSTDSRFVNDDLPLQLSRWGDIMIDGGTNETTISKVFAGGDCVTGPATVVQAVAAGRNAAISMDSYVMKGYIQPQPVDYSCSRGTLEDLPQWELAAMPKIARVSMPAIDMAARRQSFAEIELGYSEQAAISEAQRCLECGCGERYACSLRREASASGIEYAKPIHERPYFPIVADHPFIVHDHNKCIACGSCVAACAEVEGPDILGFHLQQGRQLVGSRCGLPLAETDCVSCGQCVNACPCGALSYKSEKSNVFKAINDPTKTVVAFVAPAVRSLVASHFDMPFAEASPFLVGLLKQAGFDKVFDLTFAADLTIMEETTEFLTRVNSGGALPQFTSCCPGWINFVEKRYPELIPHLSSCKSPQMMLGATIKNHYSRLAGINKEDLYVVSIVPCLAKKSEAARPEFAPGGLRDVDAVLTTGEVLEMVSLKRIDTSAIVPMEYDAPYAQVSGAGILFGASGGVAEAALRMAVEQLTGAVLQDDLEFTEIRAHAGGMRETTFKLNTSEIRIAVISGLNNAEPIVQKVAQGLDTGYDLIEIMACPGGCICGAGHPVPEKVGTAAQRQQVLVDIDKTATLRKSQENPAVLKLYADFYGEPNSPLAHELLHTCYSPVKR